MISIRSLLASAALLLALALPVYAQSATDVPAGKTAVLTVTAQGTNTPATPFAYVWRKTVGTATAVIAGATSASLTLANVTAADAGVYTAVVSNSAGSTTSDQATINVPSAPSGAAITVKVL